MTSSDAEHDSVSGLDEVQTRAIAHIRGRALSAKSEAIATMKHIFRMSNLSAEASIDDVRTAVQKSASVVVHFHPDRPISSVRRPVGDNRAGDGNGFDGNDSTNKDGTRVIAQGLLADGYYRSQFETGLSNGSVSAYRGGARDEWERRLFGGAYHDDSGSDEAVDRRASHSSRRPKYGALDLLQHADGPAPRFGSCFLVLKKDVLARTTLTYGGSQDDVRAVGTVDEPDAVLAELLEESFVREAVLGATNVRPPQLLRLLKELNPTPTATHGHRHEPEDVSSARREGTTSHNLDHMIEAQIHGPISLARDVEALVADPSLLSAAAGETATALRAICAEYAIRLETHPGFRLRVADVPLDFRGPSMPSLAARVAPQGVVDAEKIGAAARDLAQRPGAWADRGTEAEVLQELKLLWHVLVKYGVPAEDLV